MKGAPYSYSEAWKSTGGGWVRTCKACKHAHTPWHKRLFGIYDHDAVCKHPELVRTDRVSGEKYAPFCFDTRRIVGACGPSGHRWEEKK